jgi:hypothetical protein
MSSNRAVGQQAYTTTRTTGSGGISLWRIGPGNGSGGGIYMSGGTLTINSSTIVNNEAIGGSSASLGPFPVSGNGYGGGLYVAAGTVSINNSTLAGNQAVAGSSGYLGPASGSGGGISNAAGASALQIHDTILADNTADNNPDVDGGVTSQGHNLIGNTTGGSGFAASDLLNVKPQLGPLQNNGGPTPTMALLPGSPALNAGDNTGAPAYDQRGPGFPRIVNGVIDIGAFEVQSNSSQMGSLAVSAFLSPIQAGTSGSFTVTALNPDGSIDTSYTGTVHFTSSDRRPALPADYTFTAANAGTHTFSATLFTAGAQAIAATDTTTGDAGAEVGITVTPAGASQLAFVQQPSTATAGQAISPAVVVDVEDAYGNLVSSNSSTVTVTLSSGTFAGGSATVSATASGGVATFSALTIDKASSYTLTATDGSLAPAVSAHFSVTPAAASRFILTGPSSVSAGVPFSLTLTVEDAYGNVVTGYTGTVHFSSTDNRALLPANYTFTAGNAGAHTFTGLVLHKKGKQQITVTATDTQNRSLTGSIIVDVL